MGKPRLLNPEQAQAVQDILTKYCPQTELRGGPSDKEALQGKTYLSHPRKEALGELRAITAKPGDKAFCEGCKWWKKCPSTAGYYWNCEYKGGCADGCPEQRWEE